VRAFDFSELTGDDFAGRSCESILYRFLVFVHRGILSPFALGEDRFVISTGDGGLQIDPGPMHGTGGAARFFWS
jgi:hypothetical protein